MFQKSYLQALAFLFILPIISVTYAFSNITEDGSTGRSVILENVDSNFMAGAIDLIIDDGTRENAIGDEGQFIWLNVFTPTPDDYPFQLEQISVVFGTNGVNIGDPIELLVYSDLDGDNDPGTGAVLLGSVNETIQFNDGITFSVYNLAVPIVLSGPGDVIIGVVNSYSFEGNNDFPAGLDQTVSQGRSWAATYLAGDVPPSPPLPADEQWGTIDSFGFPGNWIIRGSGTRIARVPTMSNSAIIIMGSLLLVVGIVAMRRTRSS